MEDVEEKSKASGLSAREVQKKKRARLVRNLRESIRGIARSAGSYAFLHVLIDRVLPSRITTRLPTAPKTLFLVNSLVSGAAGLRTLLSSSFSHDLLLSYPPWLHSAFARFGGYMIYDLLVQDTEKLDRAILLHHVLGLVGVVGTMTARKGSFFPGATLVTELSLVSVYVLQALKARGTRPESPAFKRAVVGRVVSTLLLRTFVVPVMAVVAWIRVKRQIALQRSRAVGDVSAADVARVVREAMPWWVLVGTATNLAVFTTLNLIWTKEIVSKSVRILARPSNVA